MKKQFLALFCIILISLNLCAQNDTTKISDAQPAPFRVGKWLPSDKLFMDNWIKNLIVEADLKNAALLPVMQEFKDLIESDPTIYMLFNQMFSQVPKKPLYHNDPTGKPQVRDYNHMLQLINHILITAPEFDKTGLVGFPINAIFDWSMGTQAGFAAFTNEKVNRQLKKILNEWAKFLNSSDSRYVLSDDPHNGWFGKDAMEAMPNFAKVFKCNPELPYYGFTSWDNFFTREFRDDQRPVAFPNDDAVIANACESAPYRIAEKVKSKDQFWIKAQPYSLDFMLAGDSLAPQFAGGTIYQAFLSALSYHRWHSPVSGKIVKIRIIDGTYYAEALSEKYDPAGPNESQAFITEVATRVLIFIQADNPDIGLMCVMFVGMAEVSTCDATVVVGQHVNKGDELGMFHFGGSTHCLIFRPEVKLIFDLHGQKPGLNSSNIPVRDRIATVVK
jgi:phosphatidylserine decarboxylase